MLMLMHGSKEFFILFEYDMNSVGEGEGCSIGETKCFGNLTLYKVECKCGKN